MVLSLLLAFVVLALYNPIIRNGFINIDDNLYLLDNPHVHEGLRWATIKWAFTSCEQANWHPLTWLSHALDWQLYGRNPAGHHYMNVVFHAANAVLLFLLLESATGFMWRSLIVAAMFALHPVNVESVAWAAERKNVLSMMFFLLALLAYGWYARQPSLRRYGTVVLLFACALMAKPQVVTFPFVLLLWDYWPLQRLGRLGESAHPGQFPAVSLTRLIWEKIPFVCLSAGDAAITMYAQAHGAAVRTLSEFSFRARLENAIVAYARYVGHAFWPVHLSPSYAHRGAGILLSHFLAASGFLACATVMVLLSRRRYVLAGWLWFLGILVPMIGIVQVGNQAMADRYAYIPFIGLFWIVTWSCAEVVDANPVGARWLAVPVSLVLAAAAFITHRQIPYWHDSDILWTRAIDLDYGDWIARSNLCGILVTENRPEEAIAQYNVIKHLHKYPTREILRFADYEMRHGHSQDAVVEVRGVLAETSDPRLRASAFIDLGVADLLSKNLADAQREFETAQHEDPQSAGALLGLGLVAGRRGDFDEAAKDYALAARIEPTDLSYVLLGAVLEKTGHFDQALMAYGRAQEMSKDLSGAVQRASALTGMQFHAPTGTTEN